jgi:lipid A oxidase
MRLNPHVALLFIAAAPSAGAEWYAAGYVGASFTHPAAVRLQQPGVTVGVEAVKFAGRPFDSPVYYGYRVGAFPTRHIGLEAEFIHAKVHAEITEPLARYARKLDESHGLNFVLGNVVFRKAVGRVTFSVRGGGGLTVPHPETDVFGASREDYQFGGPALHAAAGGGVRVWRMVHVIAEYKHTWTRQHIDFASGEARFRLHTEHLVTGVALHFGGARVLR